MFQNSTNGLLSKEIRIRKHFSQKTKLPHIFCQKIGLKDFPANPKSHEHWRNAGSYEETYTLESIFQVIGVALKLSQRAKTIEKNCSTPIVLWPHHLSTTKRTPKSSQMLLQAIQMTPRSPIYFYCLYNWIKSLSKSQYVSKKPMFW